MHYQLQAQQDSEESQFSVPAYALFTLWASVYHLARKLASPQAPWLALSGPLLLRYCHVGIGEEWMQTAANLHCLVQSCAFCSKAIPLVNQCSAAPAADSPPAAIQHWLQQHPQHLAALQAALVSPGLQRFLWQATAILTSGLHTSYKGASVVYSSPVPADHHSLSAGVELKGRVKDDLQVVIGLTGDLLSCLSYLHVTLPAEEMLKVMVEVDIDKQQQQQEKQHVAAGEGLGTADAGLVAPLTADSSSLLVDIPFSQSSSTSAPVPLSTPPPQPPPAASWSPSPSSSLDYALPHPGFAAAADPGAASCSSNSLGMPFGPVYDAAAASACGSRFWNASRAQVRNTSPGAATAASPQVQQQPSPGDTAAAPLAAPHQLAAAASEAAAAQQSRRADDTRLAAAVPGGTLTALAQTAAAASGLAPVHALSVSKLVAEMYANQMAWIKLQHSVPWSPASPAPVPLSSPSPSPSTAGLSPSSCCSPSCSTASPTSSQPPAADDAAVGRGVSEEEGNTPEGLKASHTIFWLPLKACSTLSSVNSSLPATSSCSAAAAAAAAGRGANHEATSPSAAEGSSASSSPAAALAPPPPAAAAAARMSANWFYLNPKPETLDLSNLLAGPSSTLEQLQLVLELLLLTWPHTNQQGDVNGMHGWGWLLLLVALLQQAPGDVREELMQQRGSQLMQLLYHVLQEDEQLGGKGVCTCPDRVGLIFESSLTTMTTAVAAGCDTHQQEERKGAVPVHFLMLLLLQSLFLQAPYWEELLSATRLGISNIRLGCLGELSGIIWRFVRVVFLSHPGATSSTHSSRPRQGRSTAHVFLNVMCCLNLQHGNHVV